MQCQLHYTHTMLHNNNIADSVSVWAHTYRNQIRNERKRSGTSRLVTSLITNNLLLSIHLKSDLALWRCRQILAIDCELSPTFTKSESFNCDPLSCLLSVCHFFPSEQTLLSNRQSTERRTAAVGACTLSASMNRKQTKTHTCL